MLPLTKEEFKSHQEAKNCYICGRRILKKLSKSMNYRNVRDHCQYIGKYRGGVHSIFNLKFNALIEIPVVFRNGSSYDYHFIIKELANEFEEKFECLEENTEKYINFSVPIEKEITKNDKDGNESVITKSYKIKFIDSPRFMATQYQILLTISQKKFTKLNVKIVIAFLNMKVSRKIQQSINVYFAIKIIQKKLTKN